ncbi:hemolysin activation/secretion protein [Pseudocitrobacter faecalis]|uniref:Hemolysin activation/secretion protein n=2 Tax=Pseudocitrobacter faecalis TaxID=1398493 RepID=A0ABX9G3P4_9ENTR|nr:hemolysin activation/secretion protein [Pseudocitrobacter faecalis]
MVISPRQAAFALFLSGISFSGMTALLSPADRNSIQQQQQQLLDQNQQQRDELQRATPILQERPSSAPADAAGSCFTLNHITLQHATLMSPREQQKMIRPWQGRCLNIVQITQLTDQISDWYIQRGYITSRAYLTEQDLSGGELHIAVLEGRLQQIRLEGVPVRTLAMTFPGLEGKPLNLRDIEQGMEQINRVRTTPVQIEILPGELPGDSIVNLTATPEFPLQASVTFDNSGQKSTGVGQISASLVGNNLLGLADKWFVSGGRSSAFSHSRDAKNLAAGVSIPYGYGLFDYTYTWNDYLNVIDNAGYNWRSTGDTETHRVNYSHVLFRNGDLKTGVSLGLNHRVNRNFLDGVKLESSSQEFTSLLFGLNHTQKILGGVATFNPTFSRGMPWFNATDDHLYPDQPKAQFRKWSVNASWQRGLTDKLWWLSSVYWQWSPDRLYGSERLSIGGESSVRGFKEQYISGDNGGYWRNEINYTLFTMPVLGQIGTMAALDGGWLKKDASDQYAAGTLWGGAVGLTSAGRWFSSQFTIGTPLAYPGWLSPDHLNIYYRISVAL